ncbi:MAG: hypothetical protein WC872_03740 [Candidatus Absconditabacterales bacterium]
MTNDKGGNGIKILLRIFTILIGIYIIFSLSIFFVNRNIEKQKKILNEQEKEIQSYEVLTGYNKLMAVKNLEENYKKMPRSEHIDKIISMLKQLKKFNQSGNITLSNFSINLEKLNFKGKVGDLSILYNSIINKGGISFLDQLGKLDFIDKMKIQDYNKASDSFEFTLNANLNQNDK